ncbi:hypothetical protein BDZ97DRAFT_1924091 [Flammula alnicola]|nr:hypothetical protein BDZ97DRAFT_1924091 [Flammula alnicola]
MWKKKLTEAQKAQRAAARAAHYPENKSLRKNVSKIQQALPQSPRRKKLQELESRVRQQETKFRSERRRYQRLVSRHQKLADDLKTSKTEIAMLQKATARTTKARGLGTESVNVLDLKDFHVEVRDFIQSICDNPDLLLAADATPKLGSLDGKDWERPDVIEAIQNLSPKMPHLKDLVIAFFAGTLATWLRFTDEFAPGGLIDTCTAEELAQAWMLTTNDTNEGALGAFRVEIEKTPRLTAHQYNAQAMF